MSAPSAEPRLGGRDLPGVERKHLATTAGPPGIRPAIGARLARRGVNVAIDYATSRDDADETKTHLHARTDTVRGQGPVKQGSVGGAVGPDERTVAALRTGDEQTFRDLFARTYPMMKRVARGYVGCDAVAEEVVQDTWMAIVTGIDRFEGRSALGTWIFSILTNQAKSHCARERRALPFSSVGPTVHEESSVDPDRFQTDDDAWPGHWATPPRPWQTPERRLLSLEARDQLKAALAQLPDRQSLIVGLRDIEGLSAEEVCDLLDLSPENQRVLLHRGRSRLRAALERYLEADQA